MRIFGQSFWTFITTKTADTFYLDFTLCKWAELSCHTRIYTKLSTCLCAHSTSPKLQMNFWKEKKTMWQQDTSRYSQITFCFERSTRWGISPTRRLVFSSFPRRHLRSKSDGTAWDFEWKWLEPSSLTHTPLPPTVYKQFKAFQTETLTYFFWREPHPSVYYAWHVRSAWVARTPTLPSWNKKRSQPFKWRRQCKQE